MAIELGCLLGTKDFSQSFENVSSLALTFTGTTSSGQDATWSHSSDQSYLLHTGSGTGHASYDYTTDETFIDRAYYNITNHRMVSYTWAKATYTTGSSNIYINSETPQLVAGDGSVNRIRNEATVSSASGIISRFYMEGSGTLHIDDHLPTIDTLDIQADFNWQDLERIKRPTGYTLGGRPYQYFWNSQKRWQLPLKYVSDQDKEIINWWWRKRDKLLFTINTSDTADQFVVQFINTQTPIQRLSRPYHGQWEGTLDLMQVTKDLMY